MKSKIYIHLSSYYKPSLLDFKGMTNKNNINFQTFEESERSHWECMENEWEREKQKILNTLRGLNQETTDFQPEAEVRL